jgi:hypothetical protein
MVSGLIHASKTSAGWLFIMQRPEMIVWTGGILPKHAKSIDKRMDIPQTGLKKHGLKH